MGERGPKKGTKYKKTEKKKIYVSEPIRINKDQKIFDAQISGTSTLESLKELPSEAFTPLAEPIKPEVKPEAPKVVVQENIKEEAEAILSGAFEMGSALMSIPEFALTIEEKLAATPSFIPIYLKYIKPKFGDNADLFAFGMVMMGVVGKRVPMVQKKLAEKKKTAIQAEVRNVNAQNAEASIPKTI